MLIPPYKTLEISKLFCIEEILQIGGLELVSYLIQEPLSNKDLPKSIKNLPLQLPGQTNVPIAAAITALLYLLLK